MRYAKNPSMRKMLKNSSINKQPGIRSLLRFSAAENSKGGLAYFQAPLENTSRPKHTALRRRNKTPRLPHRH
jgi:hypothetical protein